MLLPRSVRIAESHEETPPVAVDVTVMDAGRRLVVRKGTIDRTDEASLRQCGVDAVRRHARKNVDGACVEEPRDALVAPVSGEELPREVQRSKPTAPFRRVHIAVDEKCRLLGSRTGRAIR